MKYYKRKVIMPILFLFSGILVLISALLQFKVNNYSAAAFQLLVAVLFVFDAYVYIKPYLGMNEEKLMINTGFLKKEILLSDVISIDVGNRKLVLTFRQGSSTLKLNLLLSHLKKSDKEQFIGDLKSKLKA